MSKRNSQEAKRAARERLRAEREKQAKKDKIRRQLVVGGSLAGVIALVGGIGVAVASMNEPGQWEEAKNAEVVAPKNASGEKGLKVIVGDKNAEHTMKVYEDLRCPVCAAFEQASGEELKKDLEEGKYKASFIFATFIDDLAGGEGSKNALSALGAALDVSEEAFMEYKTALYSEEWHPKESEDKFAKDSYLLKVANEVDALKDNEAFAKDVKQGTFDAWAMDMSARFDDSGVTGTPTLILDGTKLKVEGAQRPLPPITAEQFTTAVDNVLK